MSRINHERTQEGIVFSGEGSHEPVHLQKAVDIQALWMYEAGLRPDLYYDQVPDTSAIPEKKGDVSQLIIAKLEEWGELISALVDPQTAQAARVLELADVMVYSWQYGGNLRQVRQPDAPTFDRPRAEATRKEVATALLYSELENLPQQRYSSEQLRRMFQTIEDAMILDIVQHFEMVGYHPNGSALAEIKRVSIETAVTAGLERIASYAQQGKVSKLVLQTTAQEMVVYADRLPQQVQIDTRDQDLLTVLGHIEGVAAELFAYPAIDTLAASMCVRDELYDPRTEQTVLVAGKNARNYPPQTQLPAGWSYKDVRVVRDLFPDSIIPSGFQLGVDDPQQYLQEHPHNVGPQYEVRRFSENALR